MRRRRGNVIIEFALGFAVLWACFTGVLQYGYTLWIYSGLVAAVQNGAMHASRATYDTRNLSFQTEVKNMVVYGNAAGSGVPVVAGLATANVAVTPYPATGVPTRITIAIAGFAVNVIFRSFILDTKPGTTVRFAGKYMTAS